MHQKWRRSSGLSDQTSFAGRLGEFNPSISLRIKIRTGNQANFLLLKSRLFLVHSDSESCHLLLKIEWVYDHSFLCWKSVAVLAG